MRPFDFIAAFVMFFLGVAIVILSNAIMIQNQTITDLQTRTHIIDNMDIIDMGDVKVIADIVPVKSKGFSDRWKFDTNPMEPVEFQNRDGDSLSMNIPVGGRVFLNTYGEEGGKIAFYVCTPKGEECESILTDWRTKK